MSVDCSGLVVGRILQRYLPHSVVHRSHLPCKMARVPQRLCTTGVHQLATTMQTIRILYL